MGKMTEALKKVAEERLTHLERKTVTTLGYILTQKADSKIDPRVVTFHEPASPISEQYKMLRTNILTLGAKRNLKTFVISSSVNGEGKSVTSTNLAFVLAVDLNAKSVLLVDADLRKGRVSRLLGLEPRSGLAELLSNGTSLSETLVDIGVKNLTVLPSGKNPKNPAELLGSVKMKQLITELRGRFDTVIFDAPPVISVTDPGLLGAQTDGIFFVVQAGRTQRTSIQHAEHLLAQAHARVLGYIVTNVEYHLPEYLYRYVERHSYLDAAESVQQGVSPSPL